MFSMDLLPTRNVEIRTVTHNSWQSPVSYRQYSSIGCGEDGYYVRRVFRRGDMNGANGFPLLSGGTQCYNRK